MITHYGYRHGVEQDGREKTFDLDCPYCNSRMPSPDGRESAGDDSRRGSARRGDAMILRLTEAERRELLGALTEQIIRIAPELQAGERGYKAKRRRLDRLARALERLR